MWSLVSSLFIIISRGLLHSGTKCYGLTKHIELFGGNSLRYVWRKKYTLYNVQNTISTAKHDGRSIMILGCLFSWGMGAFDISEGTMVRVMYWKILAMNLIQSVKYQLLRNCIFNIRIWNLQQWKWMVKDKVIKSITCPKSHRKTLEGL